MTATKQQRRPMHRAVNNEQRLVPHHGILSLSFVRSTKSQKPNQTKNRLARDQKPGPRANTKLPRLQNKQVIYFKKESRTHTSLSPSDA
ncbi:uncharacterized protein Dsimw501_GD26905 [Drosophila simulans]|uniref:Uncharacterized protein n=1 Tax=Drosophila simulans TaxID=7240 RepID=A0A0J9UQV6_DROSI|nr:uncharacterized protein Dsimw501_GD26905 [Drosophila simulans]